MISEIRRNLNFGRSHTGYLGLSPVVSQVVSLAFLMPRYSIQGGSSRRGAESCKGTLCVTRVVGTSWLLHIRNPTEIRSQVLIQNAIGALYPFPVHQTTPIAGVHKGHIVAGQNPEVLKDLTQSPKRRQTMAGIPKKYVRISTNWLGSLQTVEIVAWTS